MSVSRARRARRRRLSALGCGGSDDFSVFGRAGGLTGSRASCFMAATALVSLASQRWRLASAGGHSSCRPMWMLALCREDGWQAACFASAHTPLAPCDAAEDAEPATTKAPRSRVRAPRHRYDPNSTKALILAGPTQVRSAAARPHVRPRAARDHYIGSPSTQQPRGTTER